MVTTAKKYKTRIHTVPCNQIENIELIKNSLGSLEKIINGNGMIKGMKTDLALVAERSNEMSEWLNDLKTKLSNTTEINRELEIQRRVNIEAEKIKEKLKTEQNTEEGRKHTKKSLIWEKIGVIAAIVSVLVIALFSILNYSKSKTVKTEIGTVIEKVDELGSPIPVNDRGERIDIPGLKIKMWSKDFTGDSVKIK